MIEQVESLTFKSLQIEYLFFNYSFFDKFLLTLTGAESSVDRLMKQIATFVSEISDEFKVVVVQAIKSLALKFPRKHGILMNFLSSMLRDEGGLVSSLQTFILILVILWKPFFS